MCPNRVSNQAPLVPASAESIATTNDADADAEGGNSKKMYKRSFLLPVLVFVAVPLVCIATYVISVLNDHVAPDFPYISETGSLPPESCIFSQVLNVISFLMLFIVYIKYHQVRAFAALRPSRAERLSSNAVATAFGAASCAGLNVVANFQESNVLTVHLLGAGACFFFGTIYFCMQTMYSRQMSPEINSSVTVYVRLTLSVLCIVFTLTTIVPAGISITQFEGSDRKHWGPDDGGYAAHLTSTVSEWLLVLVYISFILSCVKELTNIHVRSPTVILLNVEPEATHENNDIHTIAKTV